MEEPRFKHSPLDNKRQFRLVKFKARPSSFATWNSWFSKMPIEMLVSTHDLAQSIPPRLEITEQDTTEQDATDQDATEQDATEQGDTKLKVTQQPSYIALSYAWGRKNPRKTILLNDKPFVIRENLWDFLKIAQSDKSISGEYFWIDQLCIDQTNDQEKGEQIQHMGHIYSHASLVIAWLAAEGKDSRAAYACSQLGERKRTQGIIRWFDLIREFLKRRYWSRLWVIQELALARTLEFRCGSWKFDRDCLESYSIHPLWRERFLHPIKHQLAFQRVRAEARGAGLKDPEGWYEKEMTPLQAIIERFHSDRWWACRDARDGVYGLMGLVDEEDRIEVDYKESIEALIRRVMDAAVPRISKSLEADGKLVWRVVEVTRKAFEAVCTAVRSPGANEELFVAIWQDWIRQGVAGALPIQLRLLRPGGRYLSSPPAVVEGRLGDQKPQNFHLSEKLSSMLADTDDSDSGDDGADLDGVEEDDGALPG